MRIPLVRFFLVLLIAVAGCDDCGDDHDHDHEHGDDHDHGQDENGDDHENEQSGNDHEEGVPEELLPPDMRPPQRLSDVLRDMERPLESGILVILEADEFHPRRTTARCSDEAAGEYIEIWRRYPFISVECADDMSQCRFEPPPTAARFLPPATVFYEAPNKVGAVVEHGESDRVSQTWDELRELRTEICNFQAALAEPEELTIDRFAVYDHRSVGEDVWLANDHERHVCGEDAVSFGRSLLGAISQRPFAFCQTDPLSCTQLFPEQHHELMVFGEVLDGGGYAVRAAAKLGVPQEANEEARGRRLADLDEFLGRATGEEVPEIPESSQPTWPSFVPRELQQGQGCP